MTDMPKLRSRAWFDNPENIDMTALYLERYLNFGLSLEELRSGKPIIGIAREPQKFPDAPNKPNFVSARVDPGKPYHHAMIYRLSVAR